MRKLALLSLCTFALALAGCGDDALDPFGGECTSNDDCSRGGLCVAGVCVDPSAADAGTDTPSLDVGVGDDAGGDTGGDSGTGTDTGTGTCESGITCARAADCASLTNGQCVEGCCVAGSIGGAPCSRHLGECTSDSQTTDDFVCDTEEGLCLQRCNFDAADDTQSEDCPLNSYCLAELTVDDPLALNGACIPGDCDTNVFDPEACGGTGTCFPVGNGASYCIDAGTVAVDGACNQNVADDGTQPASDRCEPGLMCFRGLCVEPCNLRDGDADCEGGLDCVAAFDTTQRNQPGVCGTECGAFSGGECGGGQLCAVIPGRFGINAWMCVPTAGATIIEEVGADCSADDALCAEGLICVGVTDTTSECANICDPTGRSSATFAACPVEGDICTPSRLDGFGFCNEECDPYPRRPGEYDCESNGDVCLPFVTTDERPTEPRGFCTPDDGDVAAYGTCDNPGFLGAPCEDFAVCLELEEGGDAQCLPLCEPFGDDQCGAATCSGIPPLVGQLNFSFCMPDPQAGAIGDRCLNEGLPCAADHSICLDTGSGPVCLAVCREGFDDCDGVGGTCETGGLNPEVVPTYMGLCIR